MAKLEMKCPFSNRLCKNCSFYIAKHYYLCYKPQYRGHIGNGGGGKTKPNGHLNNLIDFKIPSITTSSFDPFNIEQTDARENIGSFDHYNKDKNDTN
jgi:hypothetical protein